MISAIVAVDNDWGIGFNGELLEHIPEDLKYFKKLTTDNVVIMGSKTWYSLPNKPLPNRDNIVIIETEYPYVENDALFCNLEDLIDHLDENHNWFVIGGGSIYKQLLPYCDRVYVTKIYKTHENIDTYFPNLDELKDWHEKECGDLKSHNGIDFQFLTYEKNS